MSKKIIIRLLSTYFTLALAVGAVMIHGTESLGWGLVFSAGVAGIAITVLEIFWKPHPTQPNEEPPQWYKNELANAYKELTDPAPNLDEIKEIIRFALLRGEKILEKFIKNENDLDQRKSLWSRYEVWHHNLFLFISQATIVKDHGFGEKEFGIDSSRYLGTYPIDDLKRNLQTLNKLLAELKFVDLKRHFQPNDFKGIFQSTKGD